MGTNNPKVSAYVPQSIKDRLTEFREERNLSESQAVTIILAEYFQMPEVLGRSLEATGMGGVTLGRMEALEERLLNFAASVEYRLQQLGEEIRGISRPLAVHQATPAQAVPESEQNSSLLSEPQVVEELTEKADELPTGNQEPEQVVTVSNVQASSLPIELLSEPRGQANDEDERLAAPQEVNHSVLLGEPLNQISQEAEEQVLAEKRTVDSGESKPELSLSSELLDNSISKPLPGKVMAKRLAYHPDSLSKVKNRSTDEEFLALSTDKDPDHIGWKFVKKGRGYLPASELSSELQEKLLTWLKENFPEY
jgi:hypothetical protein